MAKLHRFIRDREISPTQLTERDLFIIHQVASHRFLNSRQITLLVGGSRQQVLRRLQRLFHLYFLDRPCAQVRYFSEDGSRPLIYALGNAGARLIAKPGNRPRYDNRNLKQLYMQHTLLVSDVMVAFLRSSNEAHTPRLLTDEDLAQDKPPSKAFSWAVIVKEANKSKRVGILPDRVFALESFSTNARSFYFLEADRGTMPVRRRSLDQSSIWRKLLAYEATWSQDLHQSRLGMKRFRVLFVAESKERMNNLVAECTKLPRGRGLFMFTTSQELREAPNAYTHLWHTASGKKEVVWAERTEPIFNPIEACDTMNDIAAHEESHVLFHPERNSSCLSTHSELMTSMPDGR